MPILQTRNLPDGLHGDSKDHPIRQHSGMAQQATITTREMPRAASRPTPPMSHVARSEPPAERQKRIGRRKAIFERMSHATWKAETPTTAEIAAMVHEGREERAQALCSSAAPKATQNA